MDTPNTQIHDHSNHLAWYRYFNEKLINLHRYPQIVLGARTPDQFTITS